jgi:DinB superfamily
MTTNITVIDQELTSSEIRNAREYLEQARDFAVAVTEGLSEAQWNYRPASGGWSIAGNLEHIAIIQEVVLGRMPQLLASSAAAAADFQTVDAIVKDKFPDRGRKFPAPEFVHPTGRWKPSESLCRLCLNTQHLIEHLESTPGLRLHRLPSPPLKAITNGEYELMDGYQWILAAAAHTERHTKQILELKSSQAFL